MRNEGKTRTTRTTRRLGDYETGRGDYGNSKFETMKPRKIVESSNWIIAELVSLVVLGHREFDPDSDKGFDDFEAIFQFGINGFLFFA